MADPAWMSDPPPQEQPHDFSAPLPHLPPAAYIEKAKTDRSFAVKLAIKLLVVGMAVMMACNGVLSFLRLSDSSNVLSDVFVSIYLVAFAALLFFHESSQFYPIASVDDVVVRNFGFLYKPLGKGCFLVFIAFLNFGLSVNSNLGTATGVCMAVTGFGYMVLYLRAPEYFDTDLWGNKAAGGVANLPPYVPQI